MISVLISLILGASGTAAASPLIVMIDPGHGGRDHGTVKNSTREADLTLSVARRLYALLQQDKRFRPHLTREQDSTLSLAQRSRLAKARGGRQLNPAMTLQNKIRRRRIA